MIDLKSEEQNQMQLVEREDIDEEEEDLFEAIDKLIAHGINAGDIKKLQDAGIYTCHGLMMHTKKNLTGIKGLSEAKVDKICEAAEKIVNYGYRTGSDCLLKRKSVVRITTGSQALDELLGGEPDEDFNHLGYLIMRETINDFESDEALLQHFSYLLRDSETVSDVETLISKNLTLYEEREYRIENQMRLDELGIENKKMLDELIENPEPDRLGLDEKKKQLQRVYDLQQQLLERLEIAVEADERIKNAGGGEMEEEIEEQKLSLNEKKQLQQLRKLKELQEMYDDYEKAYNLQEQLLEQIAVEAEQQQQQQQQQQQLLQTDKGKIIVAAEEEKNSEEGKRIFEEDQDLLREQLQLAGERNNSTAATVLSCIEQVLGNLDDHEAATLVQSPPSAALIEAPYLRGALVQPPPSAALIEAPYLRAALVQLPPSAARPAAAVARPGAAAAAAVARPGGAARPGAGQSHNQHSAASFMPYDNRFQNRRQKEHQHNIKKTKMRMR